MPRPKLNPTQEQRHLVKQLAAVGVPQNDIARKIGIRSPKTLRKYFRDELDLGEVDANAAIATCLFQKARAGDTDALKFWLVNRAGWGRTATAHGQLTPPPFVVARDETVATLVEDTPEPREEEEE